MKSLGARLRQERERLGRTLEEISTQTKIRQSYLEAIESDRLDTIPGGFFSRSFVRQYAQVLGVNDDELERLLDAVTVPPTETVRVDKVYEDYRPNANLQSRPSLFVSPDDEPEPEFLHEAAFLKKSGSGTYWMVVALFLIVGSGAFLTWQSRPEMFENVFAKTGGSSIQIPVQSDVPVSQPAVAQAPVSPSIPQLPAVQEPVQPSTPVEVAVLATEKSWVRLIVDGERIFGGVMEAGEKRTLNAEQSAVVFTGNAGGLDFTHNGKSIGSTGPKGQVRTLVFSAQNWEVRNQTKIEQPNPVSPDAVRAP